MLTRIFALYDTDERYGEPISQEAHALQSAALAETDGAPPPLIVAALLHDIGHMLCRLPPDRTVRGVDSRHELIGAKWLARFFPPAVTEPIRLHVAAKRYLCAREPDYAAALSAASTRSLALQGAAMTAAEAAAFADTPCAADALRLRRWDEAAKDPDATPPGFTRYYPIAHALMRR